MKADAIIDKILDDARGAAAQTLREANERAEQMRKDAEAEILKKREETMNQARRECVSLRDRMLRMAELDQRKAELSVKRDVIDLAFEQALLRLAAMPDDERLAYYTGLILALAQGDESIVVSSADAALFTKEVMGGINERLAQAGKSGRLTLDGERRETGGGFIFKKDGMEANCTFRAIVNQARPMLESSVAQVLFGDVR